MMLNVNAQSKTELISETLPKKTLKCDIVHYFNKT